MKKQEMDLYWDQYPKTFSTDYFFGPGEIVLLRFYEYNKEQNSIPISNRKFIEVPCIICTVTFDEPTGSPAPISKVKIFNYWKTGELSGSIDLNIVVHRYQSPNPLEQKHLDIISDLSDNPESLYYVTFQEGKWWKIYPWRKEKILED